MQPHIVAQRLKSPVYLVQIDDTYGRVLDLRQRRYFDQMPLVSIYARGYWVQPASDTPPLDELLRQIGGE